MIMAVRLGAPVIVEGHWHGEKVAAHFLPYTDPEMKKALNKLIFERLKLDEASGLPRDNSQKAREEFFDAACIRVEGYEDQKDGEWLPLTPENFPDWQDRVPAGDKQSFAAEFEEKRTLRRQERKN